MLTYCMHITYDIRHTLLANIMEIQFGSTISLHYIFNKRTEVLAVTNTGGTQAQVWDNSCIMLTVLSGEFNGY